MLCARFVAPVSGAGARWILQSSLSLRRCPVRPARPRGPRSPRDRARPSLRDRIVFGIVLIVFGIVRVLASGMAFNGHSTSRGGGVSCLGAFWWFLFETASKLALLSASIAL